MTTFAHVHCDHGSSCKTKIQVWARSEFGDASVAFQRNKSRFMVHKTGGGRAAIRNVNCDALNVDLVSTPRISKKAYIEPVLDESKLWYITSRTRTVPPDRVISVLEKLGGSARVVDILKQEPGLLRHTRMMTSGNYKRIKVSNDDRGYFVYSL
jgi:hypothetical protein